MPDWHDLGIADISRLLRCGAMTSVALTEHMLARIESINPTLNVFITITADFALEAAQKADRDASKGRWRGPLHGIPIAIKDNIAVAGVRMTCGSKLFANHVPQKDADVVRVLKDGGAVLLGKAGMHELAYGTTGENPFWGPILNPRDPDLDAGGSSGGSAGAVAAKLAFAALGTDTACSIRFPAHCCGIVGFKPSFDAISTAGVMPLVKRLDHIGHLTRNVSDAALTFAASAGLVLPTLDSIGVKGMKIGVIRRFFFDADARICETIEESLRILQAHGAVLCELDKPDIADSLDMTGYLFREAYDAFAEDFASHEALFSPGAREKLARKSLISSADHERALRWSAVFAGEMDELLGGCDVLVAPTAATLPAMRGQWPADYDLLASRNATVFNLSRQPSVSIPVGSGSGTRVGLMINARRGEDFRLLQMATAIEDHLRTIHP